MSETTKNQNPELVERDLERLIQAAGPRPEVPESDLAAIKAAAREDWRRMVEERTGAGRRRAAVPLALAATLLVALSAGWWWRSVQPTGRDVTVATVELLEGAVEALGENLVMGQELPVGAEIVTAAATEGASARVAMRLDGGPSVRLDDGTCLRLVSDKVLELSRGAVYVDSGGGSGSIEVRTALGSVRDIGTQFEVRLGSNGGAGRLRVRVREGEVELESGAELHSAVAGEVLTLAADGSLDRHGLAADAGVWDWVIAVAPSLEIEGLSLDAYLAWLTRETGWSLRWADEDLERAGGAIELHGTIRGLSPPESLDVVLPGSGLDYRLESGVLFIDR